MSKSILITGVAGAGKSTLSKKLRELGHVSYEIETIPGLFVTLDKSTGKRFVDYDENNPEKVERAQWVCDIEKLREIIANEKSAIAFYCGTSSNIQETIPLFDKIIVLSASPDATRERLTNRTSHDFGKTKEVQDWLLSWKDNWERFMQERGSIIVNADKSVEEIAGVVMKSIT